MFLNAAFPIKFVLKQESYSSSMIDLGEPPKTLGHTTDILEEGWNEILEADKHYELLGSPYIDLYWGSSFCHRMKTDTIHFEMMPNNKSEKSSAYSWSRWLLFQCLNFYLTSHSLLVSSYRNMDPCNVSHVVILALFLYCNNNHGVKDIAFLFASRILYSVWLLFFCSCYFSFLLFL